MRLSQSDHLPVVQPLPQTKRLPLAGSLPWLIQEKFNFLFEEQARLGDIYTIDLGILDMIVVAHPRYAQHVLRDHAKNYDKGGAIYDALRSIGGNGLATTNNWNLWLRQRRMIQPHFHRERLTNMAEIMVGVIDEVLNDLLPHADAQQPIEIAHYLARITMTIIIQTMFGTNLAPEEAGHMEREVAKAIDYSLLATVTENLPGWIPKPGHKQFQESMSAIDDLIYKVLDRCRSNPTTSTGVIGMLLDMVDAETEERMTDQQLRDEAVTMFLAGSETTASALEWSIHFLNENPEIKQRAYAEIDEVVGNRKITLEDLPKLNYIYRILQETLRMRAPGFWAPRHSINEDRIEDYLIPANKLVVVMIHLIHHHPDVWGEPFVFDPDRFLPEQSANRHQLSWIPFGSGQRQCIGRDFGLMEAHLTLARLLQRYDIEPVPGQIVKPYYAATQRTAGLRITLEPRTKVEPIIS